LQSAKQRLEIKAGKLEHPIEPQMIGGEFGTTAMMVREPRAATPAESFNANILREMANIVGEAIKAQKEAAEAQKATAEKLGSIADKFNEGTRNSRPTLGRRDGDPGDPGNRN
jgi:hypothetical protein